MKKRKSHHSHWRQKTHGSKSGNPKKSGNSFNKIKSKNLFINKILVTINRFALMKSDTTYLKGKKKKATNGWKMTGA